MKRITLYLLVSFFFYCANSQQTIAIIHVSLIDMKADRVQDNMTVLISGNKITGVGHRLEIPKAAEVIDAGGKFLMPGLWDMHAHLIWRDRLHVFLPLYMAN